MAVRDSSAKIERIDVSAYTIPTDYPESDGTYQWDKTTIVIVEVSAGGKRGMGYTYADTATAHLIEHHLAKQIEGKDALDIPLCWEVMVQSIRNLGRPGIASMAIAGVDNALWDLKGKLLDLPLALLLGMKRQEAPIYGSGGFTSYPISKLQEQLAGWVQQGIPRVKMKIGTHPDQDIERVKAAREAIGPTTQLMVDANGAYTRKQALAFAEAFSEYGVVWFEEPVSADDLVGLHEMVMRAPAGMNIAAGEYGYDLWYFRHMLEADAVDILQADATRCAGITGWLQTAALTQSRSLPLSAHCAPFIHLAPACAIALDYPMEYFHDHVRIAHMLFDGVSNPVNGALKPDLSRPGLGLELKRKEAQKYAA